MANPTPSLSSQPSHDSDSALFARYRDGDLHARERLAERHMPLARRIARRYRNKGVSIEDLSQVAYLGLLKAIDRYEPGLGSFRRYAVPSVMGEIKRHFRDTGWALHVPRRMQERLLSVNSATESLASETGRSPAPEEVAAYTGMSTEEVLEARAAGDSYTASSLDAPGSDDGSNDDAPAIYERVGSGEPGYELIETGDAVGRAFREMPRHQQEAVRLDLVEDLKQNDIAERIGVSQMQVSRLLRRSADTFRQAAAA